MSLTRDEAIAQGAALKAAAAASPVRSIMYELQNRANEYRRAIKDLDAVNGRPDSNPDDEVVPATVAEWSAWIADEITLDDNTITEDGVERVLERLRPDLLDREDPDRGVIELIGSIGPGMLVFVGGDEEFAPVIRVLQNSGQTSLHLESQRNPAGTYRNFAGMTSPVVVRS